MCVAAVTKYHRLGGIVPKPLFLTILDAGKSESSVPAGVVLTDGADPAHGDITLWAQSLPKGPSPQCHHSGDQGYNIWILGKHKGRAGVLV